MTEFVVGTSDDRLGGVWRMASMTGLRRSELSGLTWPDVDLYSGIISVRRAAVNEQIIRAWVREGVLPAHRQPGGRKFTFLRHEVFDWLISNRYEPGTDHLAD
jgi:integrase